MACWLLPKYLTMLNHLRRKYMQIQVKSCRKETVEALFHTVQIIVLLQGTSVQSRVLLYKLDLLLDQLSIAYSESLTSSQHFVKGSVYCPFYRTYSEPFSIST
jgi:hypothetical protein